MSDPNLRIVDVRWRSRYEDGRGISFDDHEGYLAGHIPGAVFAGMIVDLSDPSLALSGQAWGKPLDRDQTCSEARRAN
jgi:3-mercaptopyruvate sulfurtransferase SseA